MKLHSAVNRKRVETQDFASLRVEPDIAVRTQRWRLPLLLLVGVLVSPWAQAEPKAAAPGGEAIKKAQGMIRQLAQEKAALEAEKTALLGEKAALDSKLKNLEDSVKRLQPLQAEVERYKSGLESIKSNLEAQLGQQRQREQTLLQKHNEVVTKAREISDDNMLLVQAVKEREQWISQCGQLNRELADVNQQLIERYQDKSVWRQLAELELLTGIGRVDTQNLAEDYRYKLKQLKVTQFESSQGAVPGEAAGAVESADPGLVPAEPAGNSALEQSFHQVNNTANENQDGGAVQ